MIVGHYGRSLHGEWGGLGLSRHVVSGELLLSVFFFFSSRRRHTRSDRDWSSDVCSSDLTRANGAPVSAAGKRRPRADAVRRPQSSDRDGKRVARSQRRSAYDAAPRDDRDRKSTRLNSSHDQISYAVFCLKKKK